MTLHSAGSVPERCAPPTILRTTAVIVPESCLLRAAACCAIERPSRTSTALTMSNICLALLARAWLRSWCWQPAAIAMQPEDTAAQPDQQVAAPGSAGFSSKSGLQQQPHGAAPTYSSYMVLLMADQEAGRVPLNMGLLYTCLWHAAAVNAARQTMYNKDRTDGQRRHHPGASIIWAQQLQHSCSRARRPLTGMPWTPWRSTVRAASQ